MKLEISRQILEKYSDIKFFENPSSGNQILWKSVQWKSNFVKIRQVEIKFCDNPPSGIKFCDNTSSGNQILWQSVQGKSNFVIIRPVEIKFCDNPSSGNQILWQSVQEKSNFVIIRPVEIKFCENPSSGNQILWQSVQWNPRCSMRTDRHDEVNSGFSKSRESAPPPRKTIAMFQTKVVEKSKPSFYVQ